jgi:hypothetical protein
MAFKLSKVGTGFCRSSERVNYRCPASGLSFTLKGSIVMRHFPLKLVCTGLTGILILTGCGGGSSPSGGSSTQCLLPLAYADGLSSGTRIDPQAQAVNRQFSACSIQRVQSLNVGLCIGHAQINELSAQLLMPNGTVLNLPLQGVNSPGSCLVGGQLYETTLAANPLQSLTSLQGSWSVRVTDNNLVSTNPVGFLVGWSLQASGLQ